MAIRRYCLSSVGSKCDLVELENSMLQGVDWPGKIIFNLLARLKTTWASSRNLMHQWVACTRELIFWLLDGSMCKLCEVVKLYLRGSPGPENSFPASWPCRNGTLLSRVIDVPKGIWARQTQFLTLGWPKMRLARTWTKPSFKGLPGPVQIYFRPPKCRKWALTKLGSPWTVKRVLKKRVMLSRVTHGSRGPSNLWAHFLHFGGLKMGFLPSFETHVSRGHRLLRPH